MGFVGDYSYVNSLILVFTARRIVIRILKKSGTLLYCLQFRKENYIDSLTSFTYITMSLSTKHAVLISFLGSGASSIVCRGSPVGGKVCASFDPSISLSGRVLIFFLLCAWEWSRISLSR